MNKYHYYATSMAEWRVGYDLLTLIQRMKREPFAFVIFLVPGAKDISYELDNYVPQVEGAYPVYESKPNLIAEWPFEKDRPAKEEWDGSADTTA